MWTEHPESEPRCEAGMGKIESHELLARMMHTNNSNPLRNAFQRSEIFEPKQKDELSNICGHSSGMSVDRCAELSKNDLQDRARRQAGERRVSLGYRTALASDLRKLRLDDGGQRVFVYDDPKSDNEEHAIVRGVALSRADQNILRDMILSCFSTFIPSDLS